MGHASFLYFAYGEQWAERAMALLCPGAESVGLAQLERHGWAWPPHGRLSARASETETVWGCLWLTPASGLEALDAYHNVVGGHYLREARMIRCASGLRIPATLYLQPQGQGEGEWINATYLDHVLAGAREAGFDASVVAALARSAERKQVSH